MPHTELLVPQHRAVSAGPALPCHPETTVPLESILHQAVRSGRPAHHHSPDYVLISLNDFPSLNEHSQLWKERKLLSSHNSTDVQRGLPEQGNSPGTVTASASLPPPTLPCTQGTWIEPLVQLSPGFSSHATPCGTVHSEHGQQIPAECLTLVRTRLRQVPVVVEELVESTVTGTWDIPPTGTTAGDGSGG